MGLEKRRTGLKAGSPGKAQRSGQGFGEYLQANSNLWRGLERAGPATAQELNVAIQRPQGIASSVGGQVGKPAMVSLAAKAAVYSITVLDTT